jgi:hypothetical protein
VILAMGDGKRAAAAIDAYLRGESDPSPEPADGAAPGPGAPDVTVPATAR